MRLFPAVLFCSAPCSCGWCFERLYLFGCRGRDGRVVGAQYIITQHFFGEPEDTYNSFGQRVAAEPGVTLSRGDAGVV